MLTKRKKIISKSSKPHIKKNFHQTIMKRSRLKNIANKTKNRNDIKNYKRQWNYVVNLNKNAKFKYFIRYNSRDSKPVWVSCKRYFSTKHSKTDISIMFAKNGEFLFRNNKIADFFNEYFGTTVEDLDLYHWKDNSELLSNTKFFERINNNI